MSSGDPDLRRQAMYATMQQNNVEIIFEDTNKGSDLTEHEKYMIRILQKLICEPEDLFKISNWTKWIKHISAQKGEHEKFQNKSVLHSFADVLLALACDKEKPYLEQIRYKMDEDQWKRFNNFIADREDKECTRLLAMANNRSFPCSPEIDDVKFSDEEDDDDVRLSNWKRAPGRNHLNNLSTRAEPNISPKCIKEESSSPDRLFLDLNNLSAEPEIEKRDFQQGSKRTPMLSRKLKIRNSTDRPTAFITDSGRKKPRNDSSNFRPLDVKVTPKKLKMTSPPQAFPFNKFKYNRPISPKNLSDEFISSIVDDNYADNSFFETSVQFPDCDDEVIENPTPPCSPVCTGIIERREISVGTTISENLENVAPNENSVVSKKSVQTKDLPSNSKIQRLKAGETTASSENRKIKGIAPRSNSQTFYSEPPIATVNGIVTIDEGLFDVPNLDPPIDQDKENYPNNIDEIAVKYPKPPSAPALTLEMFEELKRALERPPKDRVVSGFSFNILQEDLALFSKDTEWLIDMNIDFYLELIKERSARPGYPSVYIFHSFFYTLLTDKDGGYSVVEEATGEDDIFKYDLVFFPVNLSQHWRLVVVQFPLKALRCYDSMPHDNSDVLKHIGKYLRQEYHRKFRKGLNCYSLSEDDTSCPAPSDLDKPEPKTTRMFFESWDVENVPSENIPQQKNAIDCGVFVLQYAEYLSRLADFDFDQTHIPYFRNRMMYETLTKTLLTAMPVSENMTKS